MEPYVLVELTQRLLWLVIVVSIPVVAATVVVGLVTGILQAVTQVQDSSIGFFAKLLVTAAIIAALGPWAGAELHTFGHSLFELVSRMGRPN